MVSEPGERWDYNNSGYVLLGAILEKVSGQTYEHFLQRRIFEPLGMKQTFYDDPERIIPRRVAGYEKNEDGFVNAAYLSMTQPYAAGALASTVDDLARWDSALYTENLLKPETLEQANASSSLSDGAATGYGYGWIVSEYAGHRLIEHGGGINGFRSRSIRLPDDHVFVAALSNNGGANPEMLAFQIAALTIGEPYHEPTPIVVPPEELASYEGVYEINGPDETRISITRDGNQFFFQYGEGPRLEIAPLSAHEFFFKDTSFNHLYFESDPRTGMTTMEYRGRTGMPDSAKKLAQAL